MPFGRLCARMLTEEKRQQHEERERRRTLWIQTCALVYVGRVQANPPKTKQEYDRELAAQKKGKPPKISPSEWRKQEEARKFWEELSQDMNLAVWHPAHFERLFRFPDHLFGEPPEPPKETVKPSSPADVRREIEERE
jgi:hypothetical protein